MIDRAKTLTRIDLSPTGRPPSAMWVTVATMASIVGSLLVDALLVAVGQAVFPSTKGYAHFGFSDYGKLTVIGVVVAGLAWPLVTRLTSAPRWVYLRLAVAVTVVLWLPDLYILAKGQPAKAVAVLMVMHLAIAVVTYNCVVRLAPVRADQLAPPVVRPHEPGLEREDHRLDAVAQAELRQDPADVRLDVASER